MARRAAKAAGNDGAAVKLEKTKAYKSEMRRLQRYTTTKGTQRRDLLKSPKVNKVIENVPTREIAPATFAVSGLIRFSSDKRRRTVRLSMNSRQTKAILEAGSPRAQAELLIDFGLRGASISGVDSVEVID